MDKRIVCLLFLAGLLPTAASMSAQQCHRIVQFCLDPVHACLPVPTSLRPLSTLGNNDDGFNPGGACGTYSCYRLLRCPCGNALSSSVCLDGGGGGGACDCGPNSGGGPCSYSVDDLNKMLDSGKSKSAGHPKSALSAPAQLYLPDIGTREAASRYLDVLKRLRSFYQKIATSSLEAKVSVNFPDRAGEGMVVYQADKEKYRLRSMADPRLGLADGLESAFDGNSYQLFYLADSRLSLHRENPGQVPGPFPNPFFLPVSFLGAAGDACDVCDLSVREIVADSLWLPRENAARGQETGSGSFLILPGGSLNDQPFYFRLTISADGLLSRVESVFSNGDVFRSLDLLKYQPVPGSSQLFPRHIVWNAFDESGQRLGDIHYMITNLQVNAPIEAKSFSIPFRDAKTVIDEDKATFLKHQI